MQFWCPLGTRLYITVPGTFKAVNGVAKLEGLCGNYDGITNNDFGAYASEQDFGNSWAAKDPCPVIDPAEAKIDTCQVSVSIL